MILAIITGLVIFGVFEAFGARDRRHPIDVRINRIAIALCCALAAVLLTTAGG